MKHTLLILTLSALLLAMVSPTGCATSNKIGDILADPSQYEGREVSIS